MDEDDAFSHKLSSGLDPIQGIFAQIGSIALNGVLDAGINVGETVAIFGMGVVGIICAQLAKLSGAEVIVVDIVDKRLEFAKELGIDHIINSKSEDVADSIKKLTSQRGIDVVIDATGAVLALSEAVRSCVFNGKVIALGFYQNGATGLYLGEEFHHNRIKIICSQIGGINSDISNRWDRNRLDMTIMKLQENGKLKLKEMITHKIDFHDTEKIYNIIKNNPSDVLQAVLCFNKKNV